MKWSPTELARDAIVSREEFRQRRYGEPMDRYLAAFEALERANRELVSKLPQLFIDPVDPELVASLVRDPSLRIALRYLGAPPISQDDLENIGDASLAWTRIRTDPAHAAAIRDVIRQVLDPKRFPWIYEGRPPMEGEPESAVLASTVVAASQSVQTSRRGEERKLLEGAVADSLIDMGLARVAKRRIENLRRDAPGPGEFCERSVVGEDEADVVIGLYDHRILALECKASNSEINSRKRINKEIAQNAQNWIRRFGSDDFIPAGLIKGVFKPSYLESAQEIPIVFFWAHRMEDLRTFVRSTAE